MSSLRALWMLLATSVRVSPAESAICLAEPAGQILQLLQPLYLAWFVVGAIHHDLHQLVQAAGAYVVSACLSWVLGLLGTHARLRQMERVGFAFDTRVGALTAGIPTLDHLESARYLDQIQTLRDQQGVLGGAWMMLIITINNVIFVTGTLALAIGADWRLLLVAAAGAPIVIATRWTMAWQSAAEATAAPRGRLTTGLLNLGLTPTPGAELRVFGLADTLRRRLRVATASWRTPMVSLAKRQALVTIAGNVVFFGTAGGVLAWIVRDAIAGTVSIAALTLAVMLVGRLQNTSQRMMFSIQNIGRVARTADRYLWLVDYQNQVHRAHLGTARPPHVLRQGIRLESVSYHYRDSTTPALDNVSLDLPAGTVVALVGENGAGKSTLVKLLTGMYQPDTGRILIDGVDLAAMDLTAWRARTSGAFQDHARLEFTMLESIGVGDLSHLNDHGHAIRALQDAGSEQLLNAAPSGMTTQLGTSWPGGIELSGGQWQRLAIGRGMMREHPLLLALDEPTAALDPAAEHALFERYAAAGHRAGRRGAVTILVTHRFSTVAAATLIIVLDGGRVIEAGSHTELLNAGHKYAELYELQARGYRPRARHLPEA